ncbi:MAG: metallophosphoesterase [Vulcanimicrobiota bacterium]
MKRSEFLRAAALLGLSGLLPRLARAQTRELHFVQWSDVHWGSDEDSPSAWREALERGLQEKPALFVFTGDHGDNGEGRGDFAERARGFWMTARERLGDHPLVLTLGNADFRHNYQTDPSNLKETENLYREIWGERYYLDELGNGVQHHQDLDWISLNAQIFSYKNRYAQAEQQAQQSLDWLVKRLDASRAACMLLLHIPPTVDLFNGLQAWRPEPLRKLGEIMRAHARPLTILCGHFHRNEVHAISRPQGEVCVLVASSLSRKYSYSPNWRSNRWKFSPTGQLLAADYDLLYPGHPEFRSHYRVDRPQDFLTQVDRTAYLNDLFARHPQIKDRWKELIEQFWVL